jgi:hypothetical protein
MIAPAILGLVDRVLYFEHGMLQFVLPCASCATNSPLFIISMPRSGGNLRDEVGRPNDPRPGN